MRSVVWSLVGVPSVVRLTDTDRVALVVAVVGGERGHTPDEIYGLSRELRLLHTRWLCWSVAREITGLSYPYLGRLFDRDHSTVMHGLNQLSPVLVSERDRLCVVTRSSVAGVELLSGGLGDLVLTFVRGHRRKGLAA